MPIPATPYIWFNGKLVAWEKATVHVLAHALHYGSSVFEGIRAYETPKGVAIFRLLDHTRRLFDSAKIYRIQLPFSADQVNDACRQVIAVNSLAARGLHPSGGAFAATARSAWRRRSIRRWTWPSPPGNGASTSDMRARKPASMCACLRGSVSRPTPCRRSPRRAATTSRAS